MKKTNVPALDKLISETERDAKRNAKVLTAHAKNLAGLQKIRELIRKPKKK